MTIAVRHAHQTAIANDASKDVSANAWNDNHTVEGVREKLTADTTINVPSTYATLQAALDYAATIDFGGKTLTIQLAAGTYDGQVTIPVTVGQSAASNLLIKGDAGTPSNVVLTTSVSFGVTVSCPASARCRIQGVRFTGTDNALAVRSQSGGLIEILDCNFGTGCFYHLFPEGGTIYLAGDYSVSAGAFAHWGAEGGGKILKAGFITITITGTPAFSYAFALSTTGSYIRADNIAFTGSATGTRWVADNAGGIDSKGSGATYLPGNGAGSTTSPGYYI